MAKSADNFLTLENVFSRKESIRSLTVRRSAGSLSQAMEYSEAGLRQAEDGLNSLLSQVAALGKEKGKIAASLRINSWPH